MSFRVLDAGTPEGLGAWRALWEAWPRREVMAHPEYVRLFAGPGQRAVCAVGEDAGGTVLFPLLLRPLAAEPWAREGERRWDATSPYGYGGPFAWGDGPRDDDAFWRAHAAWCADERIVTTFARLSLFPAELAPMPGAQLAVRLQNVVVPLAGGIDAVWRGYETKVRAWVRKAEAAGVEVEVDRTGARLDDFARIYEDTMRRRGADEWYFFPRAFFDALVARLAGHLALVHARHAGETVSSDLVLCSAERVYYFLGGTLERAFPLGPNYALKHGVARWAASEGKREYVLGGGYRPGDTLFRYKRAYARHGEVPFRVASFLHDEAACRDLCAARAAAAGPAWTPRPGFFPPYRG